VAHSVEAVSKLLVKLGLCPEVDSGRRAAEAVSKTRKGIVHWDEFNSMFCKGIFKEVLFQLSDRVKAMIRDN